MICFDQNNRGAELLLDYSAGTLTREQALEIDQHAATCVSCQKLLAAQREAWSALETFSAPEVSADFDQRLYARIAEEQAGSAFARWWKRWFVDVSAWKPALAGAAACAIVAIGLTVNTSRTVPPTVNESATKQASIDNNDIEQVEQILEDLELLMPEASTRTTNDRM